MGIWQSFSIYMKKNYRKEGVYCKLYPMLWNYYWATMFYSGNE